MNKPYPLLYELQKLTVDLSLIDRQHLLPETNRRENDVEHSLAVAILCWYIHDKNKLDLDIAKILKYALTHDFVERYAGDVPSFAPQAERDAKLVREKESLDRLSGEFEDFPDMISIMQNYETRQDPESLFVWSVDKIQQLIMGDLDSWRCYAEDPVITYEEFIDKYTELSEKSSPYCREIFEGIIEYSLKTYFDRPNSSL